MAHAAVGKESAGIFIGAVAAPVCLADLLVPKLLQAETGQVELIFSLLASIILFNERLHKQEMLGIALILLSVLVLIL